jgi:hypothetical protein
MSISYTLKLSSLKKTNIDDLNDVIIQTNWVKIGTDENGNTGSFPGSIQFDLDTLDSNNFISYEDLTEEIVLEWIQSSISEAFDAHANMLISQQIDEKTSRVVEVTGQFPWTPEPVIEELTSTDVTLPEEISETPTSEVEQS